MLTLEHTVSQTPRVNSPARLDLTEVERRVSLEGLRGLISGVIDRHTALNDLCVEAY